MNSCKLVNSVYMCLSRIPTFNLWDKHSFQIQTFLHNLKQINLCIFNDNTPMFPFIFRGALDVRARTINDEMKIAAVYAISALAKEPVPEEVLKASGNSELVFGQNYIIPKPMAPRLCARVASAVAQAAIDSGVAAIALPIRSQRYPLQLLTSYINILHMTFSYNQQNNQQKNHRE